MLVGSANCTLAALGRGDAPGINEEACLYRQVPAGRVLDELGLGLIADGENTVDPAEVPAFDPGETLPLDDARASDPGTFEAVFDRLRWWPSSPKLGYDVAHGSARIELVDDDGDVFDMPFEAAAGADTATLAFSIPTGVARPRVARIRFQDGRRSGAAVVSCVGELRSETREPMGSRGERAAAALDDAQEEGLWLLEILDDLDAADHGAQSPPDSMAPRRLRVLDQGTGQAQMLDYAAFLAGRRRRVEPGERERNSLAGSASSLVRAFLNRALGMALAGAEAESGLDDDREILRALDTGDEVADGASAIEARAFGDAVTAFGKRIADAKEIGSKDILRLRALITVIAIAGFGEATPKPTAVQVLPTSANGSAETWPRLIGRTLHTFFGGRDPAVQRLALEAFHDRLPTDVLETWATCVWAGEIALAASRRAPPLVSLVPILQRLVEQMNQRIALSSEERSSREFVAVLEALNDRFQARLGLNDLRMARIIVAN